MKQLRNLLYFASAVLIIVGGYIIGYDEYIGNYDYLLAIMEAVNVRGWPEIGFIIWAGPYWIGMLVVSILWITEPRRKYEDIHQRDA